MEVGALVYPMMPLNDCCVYCRYLNTYDVGSCWVIVGFGVSRRDPMIMSEKKT